MIQVRMRRQCLQTMGAICMCAILMLAVCLIAPSAALARDAGYFYLQEDPQKSNASSCSDIFAAVVSGKTSQKAAVTGGIIGSLRYMNVDYLLDDYDHAVRAGRGKKYVNVADLIQEVQAGKREIYCRIELAMQLKNSAAFDRPIYKNLLDNLFSKLDKTYAAAVTSFNHADFVRAEYAFDLIAPYKDSYPLFLQASERVKQQSVETAIAIPAAVESTTDRQITTADSVAAQQPPPLEVITTGAITRAAGLGLTGKEPSAVTRKTGPIVAAVRKAALEAYKLGPITLAVIAGSTVEADRIGPIAAAANAIDAGNLPDYPQKTD